MKSALMQFSTQSSRVLSISSKRARRWTMQYTLPPAPSTTVKPPGTNKQQRHPAKAPLTNSALSSPAPNTSMKPPKAYKSLSPKSAASKLTPAPEPHGPSPSSVIPRANPNVSNTLAPTSITSHVADVVSRAMPTTIQYVGTT